MFCFFYLLTVLFFNSTLYKSNLLYTLFPLPYIYKFTYILYLYYYYNLILIYTPKCYHENNRNIISVPLAVNIYTSYIICKVNLQIFILIVFKIFVNFL